MTKTLTEQWRERTLPEGWYYVKKWDYEICMFYFEGDYFLDTDVPLSNGYIKEVLAPVPSYEEYQKLQKRLEIATKTLEDLELANDIRICMKAQETLTKMEGVK